jgi:hypothetical protein
MAQAWLGQAAVQQKVVFTHQGEAQLRAQGRSQAQLGNERKTLQNMSRYFNFYDPLEKRYIFNNFLIVVAVVEALIFMATAIWQMDEGMLGGPVKVIPFPWKEYLVASFTAPIVLLFLFGLIIQGFEILARPEAASGGGSSRRFGKLRRLGYLAGLALLAGLLALVLFQGRAVLTLITAGVKALGLGGAYVLIALLALALLYLPLRLLLKYRLQKQAMEYQYLLTLAQRHGLVLVDPQRHPELAAALENSAAPAFDLDPAALPPPAPPDPPQT